MGFDFLSSNRGRRVTGGLGEKVGERWPFLGQGKRNRGSRGENGRRGVVAGRNGQKQGVATECSTRTKATAGTLGRQKVNLRFLFLPFYSTFFLSNFPCFLFIRSLTRLVVQRVGVRSFAPTPAHYDAEHEL